MMLLIVMVAATGTAVVIDRSLAWWRSNRWRRVARHEQEPNRASSK